MTLKTWRFALLLALSPLVLLALGGCNQETPKAEGTKGKQVQVAAKADKKGHDHSGWWCDEHGVPEEICGQCNAKVAAEFKKKGDWCKEHDRPDSQCFICHPELMQKFAAQFRAKYGTEPPPIQEEADQDKKDDKK